jgi:hypothetical protein
MNKNGFGSLNAIFPTVLFLSIFSETLSGRFFLRRLCIISCHDETFDKDIPCLQILCYFTNRGFTYVQDCWFATDTLERSHLFSYYFGIDDC